MVARVVWNMLEYMVEKECGLDCKVTVYSPTGLPVWGRIPHNPVGEHVRLTTKIDYWS